MVNKNLRQKFRYAKYGSIFLLLNHPFFQFHIPILPQVLHSYNMKLKRYSPVCELREKKRKQHSKYKKILPRKNLKAKLSNSLGKWISIRISYKSNNNNSNNQEKKHCPLSTHVFDYLVKFLHNFRISEPSNFRKKIPEESWRSRSQLIRKGIVFLFHTIAWSESEVCGWYGQYSYRLFEKYKGKE